MNPNNFTMKENMAMRKHYGFMVGSMLTVFMLFAASFASPARSQDLYYRLYPTLSLRNFQLPPRTTGVGSKNGHLEVPVPGNGGDRYFLVPVWIWNEVDTTFNTKGVVPPGNNDGQHYGQHLEPIRSFNFQVWYHNQMEQLDTDHAHGSPIVMVGPSIVDGTGGSGGVIAPIHPIPDTGLARSFFITYSDQSSGNSGNTFERIIRIAGASEVPLPENASSDTGYHEHNGILLWLRFKVISDFPGDDMHMDSAMFNDHPGDSIRQEQDPALPWTHGNFGGGLNAPDYNLNTGHLTVDLTAQPAFELRPLPLINELSGQYGANDSLIPSMIYDPSLATGTVTRELQLDDAVSGTVMNNIVITSDVPWLGIGVGSPSSSTSDTLGWDALDYSQSYGSTVANLYLSIVKPDQLPPGVYFATVTFTEDGAVNSPFKLRVRFVRLASPNEPTLNNATNTGIRLQLTNSCSPTCQNVLTFGTGATATEGLDVLYGEQTLNAADLDSAAVHGACIAYFKPMNPTADTAFENPNFVGLTRDIRSATTDSTLIYQVVFNPGNVNCYPEKVCVNPGDFPARSPCSDEIYTQWLRARHRPAKRDRRSEWNGVRYDCRSPHRFLLYRIHARYKRDRRRLPQAE